MCKKKEDPHKLSICALATASGVFYGLYLFGAALFASANVKIVGFSDQVFALISSIYPGVSATVSGAFIGLIWGLICGAICGGILGALYNIAMDKFRVARRI